MSSPDTQGYPLPYYYSLNAGPKFSSISLFSDPFIDIASQALPVSVQSMLRHAEFLAITNPTFREAINRIAAYFVTDIEIEGDIGREEKEKYVNYLKKELDIINNLVKAAVNYLIYGNVYISIVPQFNRYVFCPKCKNQYNLREVIFQEEYEFRWGPGFYLKCTSCNYNGKFKGPFDIFDKSRPPIFKLWNVHDIRIVYSEWSNSSQAYHWIIPGSQRDAILNGRNLYALLDTPWDVIQAILNNKDLEYSTDYILHVSEPSLCGLRFGGVGVPRAIINFRLMYLIQILQRMNEVLAFGNVAPIRVISPADSTLSSFVQGGVLQSVSLQAIRRRCEQIIANHRNDPNSINFSPIPLQMQALGADARALIPADILNHYQDILLNGVGVPVEFYRATMQTQAAPVALRLLERYWSPMIGALNKILDFVGKRMQFLYKWQPLSIVLKPVRMADAVEMSVLRVQMANAGLLSRTTALEQVDADFAEETRRKYEEMKYEAQQELKNRQEMDLLMFQEQLSQLAPQGGLSAGVGQGGAEAQQQAAAAGGAGGGMPAGGGAAAMGAMPVMSSGPRDLASLQRYIPRPGENMDPREYDNRVQTVAKYLMGLSEGDRYIILRNIKELNDTFHSALLGTMDKIRREMAQRGRKLLMQQQFGQPQQ